MLDDNLKTQLASYLQRLQQPVELIASLDERDASAEMRELASSTPSSVVSNSAMPAMRYAGFRNQPND